MAEAAEKSCKIVLPGRIFNDMQPPLVRDTSGVCLPQRRREQSSPTGAPGAGGGTLAAAPQAQAQGCPRIPDHEMLRRIGGGSYGEVWLARSVTGIYRAVKVVYRRTFGDDRPFEREFNGIQKFEPISRSHDSQVDILHIGRNHDYFYYVMELADDASPEPNESEEEGRGDGQSVQHPANLPALDSSPVHGSISSYTPRTLKLELQRRGRLPVPECLDIGIGLTTALAHLHKHGLVHRDVKPSNVIFINGTAKLADIGLVTDFDATVSCVGTEGFLPPEGPGTPQADLYGLGKVLYEISSGKDRKDYPEPPTSLGEFSDRQELLELGEVIQRACAPNPRDRYGSAEQMQADLLLLKTGKSVRHTRRLERRLKMMTRTVIAVVAAMVLGVAPYAWALFEARRARQAASRAQAAEAASQERLRSSYLAQAHAWRLTSQAGRRAEALKVLKAAAVIRPSLELRNEAIACLALLELQVKKVWPPFPDGSSIGSFDAAYERYVLVRTNGPLSIRRGVDDVELMELPGYTPPVSPCYPVFQFSPNGRYLAVVSGTTMRRLEVWDLNGPTVMARFEGKFCRSLAFSPDGRRMAFSSATDYAASSAVEIYDLAAKRTVGELEYERGTTASCLRFHPRKNLLATCSNDSPEVQIWDLGSGGVIHRFHHPDAVWEIDWDPEGDLLAAACVDNNVYLWDPETTQGPKRVLAGHDGGAVKVSFSFDGVLLASGGWDGTVRIWDPSTGQQLFKYPIVAYSSFLSRPDYRFCHAVALDTLAVSELAPSRECRLFRPHLPGVARAETCEFSKDGKSLLTAHEDGARIWNLASGRVTAILPEENTYASVFGPAADHCLVASGSGIKEWTLTRDGEGDYVGFGSSGSVSTNVTRELLLSHDGSMLVFPVGEKVHILALANGQERTVPRSDDYWTSTALSTQNKLAVGWAAPFGGLGPVRVFDLATTNLLHQLSQKGAGRAAFSPDGNWLLVGDTVEYCLWNTKTWRALYAMPHVPPGFIGFMAFSPDGAIVALVQNRDTVRLVETVSGHELATLVAPDAHDIGGLRFSPDGTQLAVLYGPGPIQLWDLRLIRQELAALNLDWGPAGSGR